MKKKLPLVEISTRSLLITDSYCINCNCGDFLCSSVVLCKKQLKGKKIHSCLCIVFDRNEAQSGRLIKVEVIPEFNVNPIVI